MWVAVNRIRVDSPQEAEQVVGAFRNRSGQVDRQPGFVSFELWREEEGRELLVLTRWERREDFVAWTESEAFRVAHRRAESAPGRGSGSLYEVAIPARAGPPGDPAAGAIR